MPKSRKGRRKKVSLEDGVRAALWAAALIFLGVVVSVVIAVIRLSGPVKYAPASVSSADGDDAPSDVPPEPPSPTTAPAPGPSAVSAGKTPSVAAPPAPAPKNLGTLVLVIDDAGNNLRELEPFLRFPGPLTIAVLPGLPHSAEAARRIRAAGKEVFLHQPMEALGGQNPGPGAVYAGMSSREIRSVVERNLAEIGPVAGMNNHQGSRITEDRILMETILAICREQGICFLDSRTTPNTAALETARRMGMKVGERDIFLDNIQEKAAILDYVDQGLSMARRTGSAVMIGHTWSEGLAAILEGLYAPLTAQGYVFSTASRTIRGAVPAGERSGQ